MIKIKYGIFSLTVVFIFLLSCKKVKNFQENSLWQGIDSNNDYIELYYEIIGDTLITQINSLFEGYIPTNRVELSEYINKNSIFETDDQSLDNKVVFMTRGKGNAFLVTLDKDTINLSLIKKYCDSKELKKDFNDDILFLDRYLYFKSKLYPDSTFSYELSGGIYRNKN